MEIAFVFISSLHLNLLPGRGGCMCVCVLVEVGVLTELVWVEFYPLLSY